MTHEDSGHYAAKHPKGTVVDPGLADAVNGKIDNGCITCAAAHAVSTELNVSPQQVGVAIDLSEACISRCQMGLFGYSPDKSVVKPTETVSPGLAETLKKGMVDDRLPCGTAWKIARERELSKMAVAAACENLGIKIKPCQLGAF